MLSLTDTLEELIHDTNYCVRPKNKQAKIRTLTISCTQVINEVISLLKRFGLIRWPILLRVLIELNLKQFSHCHFSAFRSDRSVHSLPWQSVVPQANFIAPNKNLPFPISQINGLEQHSFTSPDPCPQKLHSVLDVCESKKSGDIRNNFHCHCTGIASTQTLFTANSSGAFANASPTAISIDYAYAVYDITCNTRLVFHLIIHSVNGRTGVAWRFPSPLYTSTDTDQFRIATPPMGNVQWYFYRWLCSSSSLSQEWGKTHFI